MNPIKTTLLKPSTEMAITPINFERRFLIFKPGQLVLPTIPLQEFFQLPKNAALHYVSMDGISRGPSTSDWQLASIDRKMPIQLITEITRHEGSPSRIMHNVNNENDQYLRQNRNLRKSRDVITEDPGDQAAVIFNYAYLPKLYRYSRSIYTELYRWKNIWGTVMDRIAACEESARTHLLFFPLPQRLPSVMGMNQMLKKNPSALIREMPDTNAWMFFEIWKWIHPETRAQSLFGTIPQSMYPKVTIIFEDAGRTLGFNLATIHSWIDDPNNGLTNQRVKIDPREMQKRILRGCIGLAQQRPEALGVGEITDEDVSNEEVRVLTEADDRPLEENAAENATFEERVEKILTTLDEDIKAHDEQSVIVDDAAVEEGVLGESITARGDASAIQSFNQETEQTRSIQSALINRLEEAVSKGQMSGIEYRRLNRSLDAAENMPNPYGGETTAREFGTVQPHETDISEPILAPDQPTLIDKSMREKVFERLDGDYIEKTLKRDIVGSVQAIQRGGFIVTNHATEVIEDITGPFESHTIKIVPIEGAPSVLRFKSVVIDKQGRIEAGGTSYRYRRQRVDLPIRKISPHQVALASYYGKTFVSRSDRTAYNYNKWLQRQIGIMLIEDNSPISQVHTGDCFDHIVRLPRAYTAMAQVWRDMVYNGIQLRFNIKHQIADFGEDAVKYVQSLQMVVFGRKDGTLYVMDENNTVYTLKDGNVEPLGSFESFMGIDEMSKPVEFTECRIFGKNIPSGMVLGYYYGLSSLIKMLGARVRQVPAGTRVNLAPSEWPMVFEDYTLVFSQDDRVATLVLSGFNQAAKTLRRYSVFHFDQTAVYFNVLESMGMGGRYLRELDTLRDLFVDPITERVLKQMGEPLTYPELVHRATQMLVTENHKRKLDPTEMRYRGAERIAGAIYTQMVIAVRDQRARAARTSAKVEMNPYNVWKHTMSDPSLTMIKDINPINNLKEISAITYTGHGGRSGRSMTRNQRAMDPNDQGTLSEATVDSADVGFNAYLSVAPRFANTEGMIKPPIGAASSAASLLSAAAMVSPTINCDDGKRIGMCSIQHSHTIACDGYTNSAIRTGYESMIAHQVDDSFATVAKQDGVVKSANAYGITVEYADGTQQNIATGRRFGAAAGMTLPHDMTTDYAVGEAFKAGDVLVYHKGFFRPDRFKKGVVNWVNGTIARTVFMESRKTHEDASSISQAFADRVSTRVTRVRDVIVRFDESLHNLVSEGQSVKYDDPLCLIEDKLSAQAGLFSEDTLNTLKSLSGQSPLAKVSGVVDRVEVYYHGHPDDMSESLRSVVEASDKKLARRRKAAGRSVVTGACDEGFRVEGEPLLMDTACVRVYITHNVGSGPGNKGVFGWQLKSEISEVFANSITTAEDGKPVDAFYGAKSLFARVVYSAFKIGTVTSLMGTAGRQMAEIYKGTRKP